MISPDPTVEATTVRNETALNPSNNYEPDIYYKISEILVAIFAIVGNALVIAVFWREKRLRRRTNYYIVSLAVADLLVGLLGIPFALLTAVGLPNNLHGCLFMISLLVVLCTISIFCLLAVSIDRYWAILYPMAYSKHVRTRTALVIISVCWLSGSFIGFLPLMGWYQEMEGDFQCLFLKVMDPKYLVFLYFVTILTPALLMAASYIHIYRVVLKQVRQIVTMNPEKGTAKTGRSHGGTMLRVLGPQQKKEVKATQNLSIIVLFFMICWIPLYTINFILSFCEECFQVNETIMLFCIILSHLNSAGNPLLYAYHLRDFRSALKHFLCQLFRIRTSSNSSSGLTGRHSSNQAYQQYHGHSRFASQRRDVMASLQSQSYGGSQLSLNHELNTITTPISAIVTQTAALAAAPTGNTREIWRISEVPSISEEYSREKISLNECSKASNDSQAILKRRISDTSGIGNSCFNAENTEGDDDVFFEECPHSQCISKNDSSNESLNDHTKTTALEKVKNTGLSSPSPQMARGVFVIEAEVNNETRPKTFLRSNSAVESRDKNNLKNNPNGDCLPSPVKVKLSPLKSVGEFLFRTNSSKRSKSLNVQNTSDSGSAIPDTYLRKENSIGVN
ncbi:hypothetical protein RI129_005641 [Pyrocoelia pectoralis]|uniref:G-protein coupled receptors family 1 profile domain-containing protein n=1 Tax=Pyrocoelia pectoralis TaxID=417401 RepID=A0AAN7VFU1_9COLE